MKKISLILAVLLIFSMFTVSVFAAETATATISSADAKAGDEIVLTVTLKNSPGISGAQFYIGYDSNVMSYVSTTARDSRFFTTASPTEAANPVKLVFASLSLTDATGDIVVADIKFKVSDNATAGEYAVSLSTVEAYNGNIVATPVVDESATVTIGEENASTEPSVNVHKHSYDVSVVEPSGAEPGYTIHECECGHSYKSNFKYSDDGDSDSSDTPVTPSGAKFEKLRDYTDSFADVTADKWFYSYVKTAYEYKLANGTSDTAFSPDSKFTVAQALTAAVNIHTTYNKTTVRAANEGESWYVPYVEYCIEKGIITATQFADYNVNITRGDMAIVFANILPADEYEAVRSVAPSDVVEESAVYPAYKLLYEAGIVGGDAGTGNYRPDDEIVRSEACVIFTRIAVVDQRAK